MCALSTLKLKASYSSSLSTVAGVAAVACVVSLLCRLCYVLSSLCYVLSSLCYGCCGGCGIGGSRIAAGVPRGMQDGKYAGIAEHAAYAAGGGELGAARREDGGLHAEGPLHPEGPFGWADLEEALLDPRRSKIL